jgi:hypothetical protein
LMTRRGLCSEGISHSRSAQFYFCRAVIVKDKNLFAPAKGMAKIKARGFALDDEEAVEGARCSGAAIHDADCKVIGEISVSGPVVRISG